MLFIKKITYEIKCRISINLKSKLKLISRKTLGIINWFFLVVCFCLWVSSFTLFTSNVECKAWQYFLFNSFIWYLAMWLSKSEYGYREQNQKSINLITEFMDSSTTLYCVAVKYKTVDHMYFILTNFLEMLLFLEQLTVHRFWVVAIANIGYEYLPWLMVLTSYVTP